MSHKLRSEFHPTTPAKPKTLPGRMANEVSKPLIATFAIGAPQHPQTDSPSPPRPARGRGQNSCSAGTRPQNTAFRKWSIPRPNRNWATSNRKYYPAFPTRSAPSALFFSQLASYIGSAGSPAMEINDRRNKPFGPGGSTRRLHPSPPLADGFRRGRTRIDEGVKGEFFLGMVPPLSGYAIVANDNYAPVAQAA